MNIEERLNNIEKRLIKLEKIEQRRRTLAIIKLLFYVAIIIGIIVLIFIIYNKIMDVIAPFQEIVDKYNETKETISGFSGLLK